MCDKIKIISEKNQTSVYNKTYKKATSLNFREGRMNIAFGTSLEGEVE